MPPSIVWGIGIGLIIALVDAVTVYLAARYNPNDWQLDTINLMLNVGLYTLIGFRVGRATGLVRDAAEGGVLAGFIVSFIGIGFVMLLKPAVGNIETPMEMVGVVAQNVAMGGLLAIVSGWMGIRAGPDGAGSRL